ncbi:hypothetical protein Q2941_35865 [Bradyrhizobium sp. UFLA05-153]
MTHRAVVTPLLALVTSPIFVAEVSGIARILDGDAIEIDQASIHLSGINAPEADQCQRSETGLCFGGKEKADQAFKRAALGACNPPGTINMQGRLRSFFIEGEDASPWMV